MLYNTPAGAVPLAPPPLVSIPLTPSVSAAVNASPLQTVVAPVAAANALDGRYRTGTPARQGTATGSAVAAEGLASLARTGNTLFLAQLFGTQPASDNFVSTLTQSSFARAASAYQSVLTPQRQISFVVPPAVWKEYSEVKYKPGLKPPVEPRPQVSLVA